MENTQQDTESPDPAKREALPKDGNRLWNYIKSRFDKDNWFGSLVLGVTGIRSVFMMNAGRRRVVAGEEQPNRMRTLSYAISMPLTAWSFFSQRGGHFPKGKNPLNRIFYALRHPNWCSSQFEYLLGLIPSTIGTYNSIRMGLKAYGMGLKNGETVNPPEKVMLFQGLLAVAYQSLLGYGHFRDRKKEEAKVEKEAETEKRPIRRGFLGTFQKIWRDDRVLLIGGILETIAPFLNMTEGFLKRKAGSGKEAASILWSAFLGIVLKGAYDIYTFQRIAHSNFEDRTSLLDKDDTARSPPDHNAKQNIRIVMHEPGRTERPAAFAQYARQQTSAPPSTSLSESFAQTPHVQPQRGVLATA